MHLGTAPCRCETPSCNAMISGRPSSCIPPCLLFIVHGTPVPAEAHSKMLGTLRGLHDNSLQLLHVDALALTGRQAAVQMPHACVRRQPLLQPQEPEARLAADPAGRTDHGRLAGNRQAQRQPGRESCGEPRAGRRRGGVLRAATRDRRAHGVPACQARAARGAIAWGYGSGSGLWLG